MRKRKRNVLRLVGDGVRGEDTEHTACAVHELVVIKDALGSIESLPALYTSLQVRNVEMLYRRI